MALDPSNQLMVERVAILGIKLRRFPFLLKCVPGLLGKRLHRIPAALGGKSDYPFVPSILTAAIIDDQYPDLHVFLIISDDGRRDVLS